MRSVQRILVALDESPQSRAALREAAQLAARLHADLEGIFVLDTELLRLGELPLACETDLLSSARRSIDAQAMERALQRQAQRAREGLEHAALQYEVRATFRLSRGNVATELLVAAATADLLALGRQGQTAGMSRRPGSTVRRVVAEAGCSLLFLNREDGGGRCVLAVFDGSEDALSSLGYARHIAGLRDLPLTVLLCGPADRSDALREQARDSLSAAAGEAVPASGFDTVGPEAARELPAIVARHEAGLLVIPRTSGILSDHDDLLRSVGCPVLLTN